MGARGALVVLHRWAGLTIAGFLVIAGVTGATLPFREELGWLCAPELWRAAPPIAGARPLPGPELAERVAAATGGLPVQVPLEVDGRHAVSMFIFAGPRERPLGYDQVVVDPFTGGVRAKLRFGVIERLPRDLPTFLLSLHYGYIAGPAGLLLFGIAALIWLLDGFVGIALSLPVRASARQAAAHPHARRPWLTRWAPAWRVRGHARGHKLAFDLHRAGGLWLWITSAVFAWSAFGMNVPAFRDALAGLAGAPVGFDQSRLPDAAARPAVGYADAALRGAALMSREASRHEFEVLAAERLDLIPAKGAYRYVARTSLDVGDAGDTTVWLDGADGRELAFSAPVAGGWDRLNAWSDALHEAAVFGLPYRIAVTIFGMLVTGLTATGVLIWSRKRKARRRSVRLGSVGWKRHAEQPRRASLPRLT